MALNVSAPAQLIAVPQATQDMHSALRVVDCVSVQQTSRVPRSQNGSTIEEAQQIANHHRARTWDETTPSAWTREPTRYSGHRAHPDLVRCFRKVFQVLERIGWSCHTLDQKD